MSLLPRRGFIGLRVKLLIGFTLIFTLVFALTFGWFYWYSSREALAKIRTDLLNTVHGATLGIDGDDFARMSSGSLVKQASTVYPLYVQHQQWMRQIHDIEPHANPYTFISAGNGKKVLWIGDVFRVTHPDRATKFKEVYDASKTQLYGGLTRLTLNMHPYQDQWGTWVSAYQPLRDHTGRIVGALGIDFSATYLQEVQQQIRNTMFKVFFLTYAVLFLLVYLLSSSLTRPLARLTHSVQGVADGNYDQNFELFSRHRPRDEIDILGRVFGKMVEQVRQREQTLQRRVQELRIEIDETRKAKQVKEIVDTELFRDLKQKARTMRTRANQPTSPVSLVKNKDAQEPSQPESRSEQDRADDLHDSPGTAPALP
ncbi:HAMP domain-containing protein (plasmid) [Deinococcus sp. KNUC1210]|uniref:HAMP domain-containing protein n=1 Tax=Deinococcus sp. KNUC1210 TaxID=2917691 RepID=UPI001EF03B38|nr:HAMP domain-containing protein [Deinococcus sp. KNUC1210]ULH17783.1 HAMP domain-containing protein [Deinococcus sp. KNUC1210]